MCSRTLALTLSLFQIGGHTRYHTVTQGGGNINSHSHKEGENILTLTLSLGRGKPTLSLSLAHSVEGTLTHAQ